MNFHFYQGLILYESTQPTTHDDDELTSILRKVRSLQFPTSFTLSRKENLLIKKMLSFSPEDRPTADQVFGEIKELLKQNTQGKYLIMKF